MHPKITAAINSCECKEMCQKHNQLIAATNVRFMPARLHYQAVTQFIYRRQSAYNPGLLNLIYTAACNVHIFLLKMNPDNIPRTRRLAVTSNCERIVCAQQSL